MNTRSVKQRFGIIGRSPKLDQALDTAIRVANTDLSVLITGESGVGKEVFSKIIHSQSSRKHNNFIAINCGAIPEGTINSELFGHEKGAFTGATADRKGYFETVNGGTIFLDEIGEMPLDTQAFLLRVLESGEFFKVGSSKVSKTDVRIVAATNVDLKDKIKAGKFREDLYYRLNTVPIHIPPLRERREDIYMLFRKFTLDFSEKYSSQSLQLEPDAVKLLESYAWKGNIRELRNVAEQVSVLARKTTINAQDLLEIIPNLSSRNLPTVNNQFGDKESLREREIFYKLLLDMKSDLNDLKSLVFELIKNNDLSVPKAALLPLKSDQDAILKARKYQDSFINENINASYDQDSNNSNIILESEDNAYLEPEFVEESLSLADMEKEYISKALKKYKGRRKDAALELGISERTLYRKIKEYGIEE